MKAGYLKLPRSFFSGPVWTEQRVFTKVDACLDLLQLAAFRPTKRIVRDKLIELEVDELLASVRFLGLGWGWKKDKVARFLSMLKKLELVRREARQGEPVFILTGLRDFRAPPDTECDTDRDTDATAARQRRRGKRSTLQTSQGRLAAGCETFGDRGRRLRQDPEPSLHRSRGVHRPLHRQRLEGRTQPDEGLEGHGSFMEPPQEWEEEGPTLRPRRRNRTYMTPWKT